MLTEILVKIHRRWSFSVMHTYSPQMGIDKINVALATVETLRCKSVMLLKNYLNRSFMLQRLSVVNIYALLEDTTN